MSGFGVGLSLAGAAARGMREGTQAINQGAYTEQVRANNVGAMESEARLRPMQEAAQTNEFGVRNQQANATRQSLTDAADMRTRTQAAMGEGWKAAKDSGLSFNDGYRKEVLPRYRDAVAKTDPAKAKEIDDHINSLQGEQSFNDWESLNQALAGGDLKTATAAAQKSIKGLYGANFNAEQIEVPDVTNIGATRTEWRVTGDNGVDRQVTPEQLQQELQHASMTMLAPHARLDMMLKSSADNAKSARDHAEKMAEQRKPIAVPEHGRLAQFNPETGQYDVPNAAADTVGADPKMVEHADKEIRATFEGIMKGTMAELDPARQKVMAEGIQKAHVYLNNGALDASGQPMSPGAAAAFAYAAATGAADESKLRFANQGGQPGQQAAPAQPTPGIPSALADPGNSDPIIVNGKTFRWGEGLDAARNKVAGTRALYEIKNGSPVLYQTTAPTPSATVAAPVSAGPTASGVPASQTPSAPSARAVAHRDLGARIDLLEEKFRNTTAQIGGPDPGKIKAGIQRQIDDLRHQQSQLGLGDQELQDSKQRFALEALKQQRERLIASGERVRIPGTPAPASGIDPADKDRLKALAELDKKIAAASGPAPVVTANAPNVERPIKMGASRPTVLPAPTTTANIGVPSAPKVETAKPTPETRAALQRPDVPRVMPMRPSDIGLPPAVRDLENPRTPSTTGFGTKPVAVRAPEQAAALDAPAVRPAADQRAMAKQGVTIDPTPGANTPNEPVTTQDRNPADMPSDPERMDELAAAPVFPKTVMGDARPDPGLARRQQAGRLTPEEDSMSRRKADEELNGLQRPAATKRNIAHGGNPNAKLVVPNVPNTGMIDPGTLPIDERPRVYNKDGSISTDLSISGEVDGKEVLIPTVINGKIVSEKEAWDHFRKTGEHFGTFDTPEHADAYAELLHQYGAAKLKGDPLAEEHWRKNGDASAAYGTQKKATAKPAAAIGIKPTKADAPGKMDNFRTVPEPPAKGYIETRPPGEDSREYPSGPWYRFADGLFGYADKKWSPTKFYEMDPKSPLKMIRTHDLKKPTFGSQQEAWTEFAKQHGLQGAK